MRQVTIKRIIVFCCVFLGCMAGLPVFAGVEDRPVAKVNGDILTESQLEDEIDEYIPREVYHGNVTPEKRAEFKPKAMEELIRKALCAQEAGRTGMSVPKQELADAMKTIKGRFKGEKQYKKALAASGLTEDTLMKKLKKEILAKRFWEQETIEKAKVTDAEAQEYYQKRKNEFLRPEAVHLRHIVILVDPAAGEDDRKKAKQEAEAVLVRARGGEDFADLAFKFSNSAWSVKGGDLGLVHKGRLDPEIEQEAFKLEIGQISGVIETIYGFNIVKLEGKQPPTQLQFEEVRDSIRKQLEEGRRKSLEEALVKRLKDKATIAIY